jgi:hypothetical protein
MRTKTERNVKMLLADGFDDAIIGVATRCGEEPVVCYDRRHCIEILMQQGMNEEEAEEYFSFNTEGAWVGPQTPMYIEKMTREEIEEMGDENE